MTLNDLYNPLVKWLLRSPLHGVMSKSTLLLTITGRKSGKLYTTPISYGREGNTITLVTSRKYQWWKNLQTPASVTVRVQGQDQPGLARLIELTPPETAAAIQKVYRGIPAKQAEQLVNTTLLIRIDLN